MTRRIRIVSQIFFFTLFAVSLFFFNREGFVRHFPTEWFLTLNPLVGLLTSIASRAVIGSMVIGGIIVTIFTIVFGRVFCGFVCPLGAAIDFTDKFLIGKARHHSRRPPPYLQRLKYVLLIALAVFAVLGIVFPLFMDPLSLATRMAALLIDPALRTLGLWGWNVAAAFSSAMFDNAPVVRGNDISTIGSLGAMVLFVAVFAGGFWDRRFWCQYVCPSGALFAVVSRFPLFRRTVNHDKCNSCSACATRQCPTRAIDADKPPITSTAECIVCGVCSSNSRGCTRFSFVLPKKQEIRPPNLARRHVIAGLIAGIVAPSILRGSSSLPDPSDELIRPPGSIPENDFLTRCIACGECIKACPNHALGPCSVSNGLMRLNTPRLMPSIGYCEPSCTACTHVCPTIAIRPVSRDEKPFVKIGTAYVDEDRCLAWKGERPCMICRERCPYQAIDEAERAEGDETRSGPVMDTDLCTGCGKCELFCPVRTVPAIRVQSQGERRIMTGPPISEKKRARIAREREEKIKRAKEEEAEE